MFSLDKFKTGNEGIKSTADSSLTTGYNSPVKGEIHPVVEKFSNLMKIEPIIAKLEPCLSLIGHNFHDVNGFHWKIFRPPDNFLL